MYSVEDLMRVDPQSNIVDAVRRSLVIEYGTIEEVREDGLVEVSFACRTREYANYITCRYFSPLITSDLKIKVPPKKGDKVMLLSPREFSPDMFTSEVPVEIDGLNGYRLHTFIALPIWTEIEEKAYSNSLEADETGLFLSASTLLQLKKVTEDYIDVDVKADANGITIETFKVKEGDSEEQPDPVAKITLDRTGNITIMNSKGVSVSFGSDKSISIGNGSGTFNMAENGTVTINGNFEVIV